MSCLWFIKDDSAISTFFEKYSPNENKEDQQQPLNQDNFISLIPPKLPLKARALLDNPRAYRLYVSILYEIFDASPLNIKDVRQVLHTTIRHHFAHLGQLIKTIGIFEEACDYEDNEFNERRWLPVFTLREFDLNLMCRYPHLTAAVARGLVHLSDNAVSATEALVECMYYLPDFSRSLYEAEESELSSWLAQQYENAKKIAEIQKALPAILESEANCIAIPPLTNLIHDYLFFKPLVKVKGPLSIFYSISDSEDEIKTPEEVNCQKFAASLQRGSREEAPSHLLGLPKLGLWSSGHAESSWTNISPPEEDPYDGQEFTV